MNLQFCYLISVVMTSRLLLLFRDEPRTRRDLTAMILLQVLGLLVLQIETALLALATCLIFLNLLIYRLEKMTDNLNQLRLASLCAHAVVLSVFASPWAGLRFNPDLAGFLGSGEHYSVFITCTRGIHWPTFSTVTMGFLLVVNEANILVRYVFGVVGIALPKEHAPGIRIIGPREYNAGRVIGILERILVYLFILSDQFTTIGFVLAAKSFARFAALKEREFAEYVLIGTLLSVLLAVLVAYTIKLLLP